MLINQLVKKIIEETGGGETPAEVYAETRPTDWLDMPTDENVSDNEIYLLIDVSDSEKIPLSFLTTFTGTGYFDPGDGSSPITLINNIQKDYEYDFDSISATVNSEGNKQVIAKIYGGTFTVLNFIKYPSYSTSTSFVQNIVEIKMRATSLTTYQDNISNTPIMRGLRYFNYLGTNNIVNNTACIFGNYTSLICVLNLDTSNMTDTSSMFYNCLSLKSIPLLDTSSVTTMSSMFTGCHSLETIPLLDTSSVNSTAFMFASCYSLKTIPLLDTSSVTTMYSMFSGCYSLETIPLLDTSSVNSTAFMFASCYLLKTIPLLDTSSVTTMSSMFSGCNSLKNIPALNLTSVNNISSLFGNCFCLKSISCIFSSGITNADNLFQNNYNLQQVLDINLSSCTSNTYIEIFDYEQNHSLKKFTTASGTQLGTTAVTSFNLKNNMISHDNLVEWFNLLPTANVSKTILLTGCMGAPDLTTAEIDAMTTKGYTLSY